MIRKNLLFMIRFIISYVRDDCLGEKDAEDWCRSGYSDYSDYSGYSGYKETLCCI